MRVKVLSILLVLSASVFAQSTKINVKGFGEIPVSKQGDSYVVSLGNYGQFSLQGNLESQEFSGSVNIDQLSKFPGFKVLSGIGLNQITLTISKEGVLISSKADTKGALEKVVKLFKISSPHIEVSVFVSKGSAQLSAALEFVDGPVQLLSIAETGTVVKFTAAKIDTKLEPGTAELSIATNMLIKPTKSDPELECVSSISYDIMSQTLSMSGSMLSRWANPLGTSKFLKKDAIVFDNVALEMGINLATLAPVNIGFAVEQGKIFTLDFGVLVSFNIPDKELAFMGKRDKMGVNDLTKFLRDGLGLKIPDIFPDIYYVENPYILFAPNGGSVGEIDIDKGLALKGKVKVGDAMQGPMEFSFDMENEFNLNMDLDLNLRKFVMNEVRKIKPLAPMANQILSTLQVRKLNISLHANKTDMILTGDGYCRFEVLGESREIRFKASLDPQQIAKNIADEILKLAGPQVTAVLNTVGSAVSNGGKLAGDIAGKGISEVGKLLGDAKIWGSHISHSPSKCDKECIPNMVNKVSEKLLPASIEAIQSFHNSIIDELVNIEGVDNEQTKQLRESHFLAQWNQLNQRLDAEWQKLHDNRTYVRFYTLPENATNGGKIYRRMVLERKQIYVNHKGKLYHSLIQARKNDGSYQKAIEMPSQIAVDYDRNAGCGTILYYGTPVKKHCGWRQNWHTALGAADKLLFYDNTVGQLEIYHVRSSGDMKQLKLHNGIRKNWASITWDGSKSAIRFQDAEGYYENYRIDGSGNLQLHSKKPPLIEVRYEKDAGCGTFLVQGRPLKKHCGWSKNWHTALGMAGQALFYDNTTGVMVIYRVDEAGNMANLKTYENIRKTWASVTWDNRAMLITFTAPDGYFEKYTCDEQGVIRLHSKTISPIELVYESEAGCGTFYREGQELKQHCGWRKTWHTVLMIGCGSGVNPVHKVLFYDQAAGSAEIYSVDGNGNMKLLQSFNNFSKQWAYITWEAHDACNGLINFQLENGYWEKYTCDERGNIALHSKYDPNRFLRLKNRWKGTFINIEKGLAVGEVAPAMHSAMWLLEPVAGTKYVKIKNRWKGTYLNMEKGFNCSEIQSGWHSAHWELEPVPGTNYVRIKNRWKETYINIEKGLDCTEAGPGWLSAQWELDYNVPK